MGAQRWKRVGPEWGWWGSFASWDGALQRGGVGAVRGLLQEGSEKEGMPKGTLSTES